MILNGLSGPNIPPPGWDGDSHDPLVARLATIAGADPSLAVRVRRRRSIVLQAFADRTGQPQPRRWILPRRLTPALAVGLVLLVVVGSVAASGPGQPMYPVRLIAEEMTLPATVTDRLTAQLDRLDLRLDEAAKALAADDEAAAGAALAAYGEIASDVVATAPPDEAMAVALEARMTAQVGRLRLLPTAASRTREEAMLAANGVIAWLTGGHEDDHGPRPGPTASPQASPSAEPTPGGTEHPTPRPSGGTSAPNATPHPVESGGTSRSSGPTPSSSPHQSAASPRQGE